MTIDDLQKEIGYTFKDKRLLDTALTHSSYANERQLSADNERLEFLGDSVLGFLTAEHLYSTFGRRPEGELTKLRSLLVCEGSLYGFAKEIGLGECLLLGKGEEQTGGRDRPSILSDAFEAVVAAIYLDGGIEAARVFVLRFISLALKKQSLTDDYKTLLQEEVQKTKGSTVRYELVGESGPDHQKTFICAVILNGKPLGEGSGRSKKEAEQQAAKEALELLGS